MNSLPSCDDFIVETIRTLRRKPSQEMIKLRSQTGLSGEELLSVVSEMYPPDVIGHTLNKLLDDNIIYVICRYNKVAVGTDSAYENWEFRHRPFLNRVLVAFPENIPGKCRWLVDGGGKVLEYVNPAPGHYDFFTGVSVYVVVDGVPRSRLYKTSAQTTKNKAVAILEKLR